MIKTMSPSPVSLTPGQISKFLDLQAAALRKSGLQVGPTQRLLEHEGGDIADEFVEILRKRISTINNIITQHITVKYRTPEKLISLVGRKQFLDYDVVEEMPRGSGAEVELKFFNLGHFISDDDLEKEYNLRALVPVDPYSLAALNMERLQFRDYHPNGTHWQDKSGRWCIASFRRWGSDRLIRIVQSDCGWPAEWNFGGLSLE